jgi:hypothetical protein
MPTRDVDRDGVPPGDGRGALEKKPPAAGVTPRPSNEGKKLRGQAHNPPGRRLPRPRRRGRHHRPTTRGLAIATALVALVGVAFYGALGNHGGRASSLPADDLEGMTDPRVTQANIQATICRRGYTRTVRPPREVTDAIKHQLVAGVRGNMWEYELDHVVPLDLGGAPLDRRNFALQPRAGACNAHQKAALERLLSIMVCAGDLTLNGAQHEIATDWRAAYKKWINGKGCGQQ